MSKKRAAESSWDSDEELLSDTPGITAFTKNSSELDLLAADEDALLSIDEANTKANASGQDIGVDGQAFVFEEEDTGDLEDELNAPREEVAAAYHQKQHFEEELDYDESYGDGGDVAAEHTYQEEQHEEEVAYSEEGTAYQEADPSLNEYDQDDEGGPDYVGSAGEEETGVELTYGHPEEQEEQVHLEYGNSDAHIEDTVEGSETERRFESESDSEDESSRHNRGKFTSERTGTITINSKKERSSIPDTLELDKEQAEQIDKFMSDKNQGGGGGGKRSSRGRGGVHNRLGPRLGMRGGQPRMRGPHPGPNGGGPNFPGPAPSGPMSPRMLMGLLRGGAQMLRGLLPAQLLNSRDPMAAQSLARALGQRGPFPEGMRGPHPIGRGDPRGPFPHHPPGMMNQMRGGMRPGPPGMRERGPPPPRMPGGPFPGPINHRLPPPGMQQGQMRMMGPRGGPGGPILQDGPRRMLGPGPHPMGPREGFRFSGGDGMLGPPPIRGPMNIQRGGPGSAQLPIRPLLPHNASQIRPGMRNQGPQIPVNQMGSGKGMSVHDRLGPRGSKNKVVPPLMGISASKPGASKTPGKNEQGQPIPSLVKTVTPTVDQEQTNRPDRQQGPSFGNPNQSKQQQKGPQGPMFGQPRHKIHINPRFQGPQNPDRQPTGLTRTVRFGTPLNQRKPRSSLDRAVQNKMSPASGGSGPVNLKRRSTGSVEVPTKVFRTVGGGHYNSGHVAGQQMHGDADRGRFKSNFDEQKRGPGQNNTRSVVSSQNSSIHQRLGGSVTSRLGPPPNRLTHPPPNAQQSPSRNVITGPGIRGPFQQQQQYQGQPPNFGGQGGQRGPRPATPTGPTPTNPFFKPPTMPGPRPPTGNPQVSMNQFSIPPPSSVSHFTAPPPRMNTAPPAIPPPVNVQSAPPRYQQPQHQASHYQTPPPASAPAYPPPSVQATPPYPPQALPTSAPPSLHYSPQSYAPPTQHPPPTHPPPTQHHPPPTQHHPPPTQHHPPPTQHHPPPTQHHSAPTQHHPPPTQHHPPPTQHHPPPTQQHHPPPTQHHPPPTQHHPPPAQHHPPPSAPSIYPPAPTSYQPPQSIHQAPPTHYQPPPAVAATPTPAAATPVYPPAQPTHTDYTSSYPPPAAHYPAAQQRTEQQPAAQYYDYSTGSYYPATSQSTTSSQSYHQYPAGQTQTQLTSASTSRSSSYYDYSASASHHTAANAMQTNDDQRTVQHLNSVGQPIQTIGRRVQPATGSQMRSIVHNVTTSPSAGSSHSSQSGRIVVDTNVSVLPGPQRVAVYNVAKQATKETLLKVCRHFGKVMSIQFTREQDRAIIQFETGDQAAKCVSKCDQKCLLKTRLTVKLLPN